MGQAGDSDVDRPQTVNLPSQAKPSEYALPLRRFELHPCIAAEPSRHTPENSSAYYTRQGKQILKERIRSNVKDEPRPQPARRVLHSMLRSISSFRFGFHSTRRDGCGRWLWRLVRRLVHAHASFRTPLAPTPSPQTLPPFRALFPLRRNSRLYSDIAGFQLTHHLQQSPIHRQAPT
jgi:hypothetical protein